MIAQRKTPEEILRQWTSLDAPMKVTFLSALLTGSIAHIYMFTNKLPNADDVGHVNAYGQGARVGRWFLELMGESVHKLAGNYSMPFFNGMIFIFILALAACQVVDIFAIQDKACCIFLGGIFVCFPPVTDTLLFMFTAPFYGIGILLAVLAAKYMIAGGKKQVLGIFLLVFATATYQAYYPLCAAILAGKAIQQAEEEKAFKEGIRYAVCFCLGILCYLLSVWGLQQFAAIEMVSYKGADNMGGMISSVDLPGAVKLSYQRLFDMMTVGYVGLTEYRLLRILFAAGIAASVLGIACRAVRLFRSKKYGNVIWLILLTITYPIAVFSLFLSGAASTGTYALMMFPVVMMYILPVIFLEDMNHRGISHNVISSLRNKINGAAVLIMAVILVLYCRFSNEYYLWMQMDFHQTYSYFTTLVGQIRDCEGYQETDAVVLLGEVDDSTITGTDNFADITMGDGSGYLIHVYSFRDFLKYYCGFDQVRPELSEEVAEWPQVKEMPSYPNEGAIRKIDDIIVVKLQEEVLE